MISILPMTVEVLIELSLTPCKYIITLHVLYRQPVDDQRLIIPNANSTRADKSQKSCHIFIVIVVTMVLWPEILCM